MNAYPEIDLTRVRFSVRFETDLIKGLDRAASDAADGSGGDDSATTRVLTGAGPLRALVHPQVITHAADRAYLVIYSDPNPKDPGWVILDETTDEEDLGLIDAQGVLTGNLAHIYLVLNSTSWYARRCSPSAGAAEH